MQVFLIDYNPIETARILDPKRLNKQIIEADWIINGLKIGNRAANHPIAKMYKNNLEWLSLYRDCLDSYRNGDEFASKVLNSKASDLTPSFLNEWYFNNFKSRLYTKDPNYYSKFSSYGKTDENWYYIDGKWYIYNGCRIGEIVIDSNGITKTYY